MPNLADIVDVAEALGSKAVYLVPERCLVVRNRHSSCTKCFDACPTHAVKAVNNVLSLDANACVSCGACTAVCPTEALVPLQPPDEDLVKAAAGAVKNAGGMAVFACARIASKHKGDPRCFAEVPCLARMEEGILLGLIAGGVQSVVLVDGTCTTCKFHANDAGINTTVASVNNLASAQGSDVRITRASEFPEAVLLANKQDLLGKSRRDFFTSARTQAATAAGKTVETIVLKNFSADGPSLIERLKVSDSGTLPQFSSPRHMRVLDAMDSMGASKVDEIDTRLFGSVSIDESACNSCGMCTVFCPTGALKKSDIEPETGQGIFYEFSAADCVQCNLCVDACLKSCLTVNTVVSTGELFDFEPRLIHLPTPKKRPGLLGGFKH